MAFFFGNSHLRISSPQVVFLFPCAHPCHYEFAYSLLSLPASVWNIRSPEGRSSVPCAAGPNPRPEPRHSECSQCYHAGTGPRIYLPQGYSRYCPILISLLLLLELTLLMIITYSFSLYCCFFFPQAVSLTESLTLLDKRIWAEDSRSIIFLMITIE